MPKPLSDTLRAAVLEDIRAGGKSARQIGKLHGVSDASVRRIAKDEGLVDAWSRDKTVKATRARVADNAAKRTQLQSDLLDDAQRLRKRAWEPYEIPLAGPQGIETIVLDLPPLGEVRAAYTSIGIIVDKDRAYEKDKAGGDDTEQARSLLGRMFTVLADAVDGDIPTPDDGG